VPELELRNALLHAADYIDAHGLQSGGFGRPGRPVCLNSAIAIGLGLDPCRLGWGPFFRRGTSAESLKVAEVVLESGLLHLLPPAVDSWQPRRGRPAAMSTREVLAQVARWSDARGRSTEQAVRALRRAAFRLEMRHATAVPPADTLRAAA
jgi:hypothetical protein